MNELDMKSQQILDIFEKYRKQNLQIEELETKKKELESR